MNFSVTVGAQQLVFPHTSLCPSWPTIRAFHAPFYYSRSLYQLSYRGTNHENQRLTLNKPFSSESIQGIIQFSRPLSRPAIFLARSCKKSLQHWIYARLYYILPALRNSSESPYGSILKWSCCVSRAICEEIRGVSGRSYVLY